MPLERPQPWTDADLHLHGGVYYSNSADVPTPDEVPDQFTFVDQTDVELSTVTTSAAVTIAGLADETEIEFTATGGTIDKNNDGNFQTSQTLGNGDTMRARVTSSSSYSTSVEVVVTGGGVSDTFLVTTEAEAGEVGDWAITSYIAAKRSPEIIFPRPDNETNAYARHRRAPSAIEWTYRCCVTFGAFPGKWELLDDGGATGLEFIRETVPLNFHTNGLQGWGVLRWTNPVVGTYEIDIQYTDQGGAVAQRTFTLEVISRENTTYFMFISTSGNNSNDGSYSSPKRNHAGWQEDAHASKQIFYRGGTYNMTDSGVVLGGSSNQHITMGTFRPKVLGAFPGETIVLDCNDTAYFRSDTHAGDMCWFGFQWVNGRVQEAGTTRKTYLRLGSISRTQIYDNHFISTNTESGFGSNPSCVMFQGAGATQERYFGVVDNLFDGITNMDYALFYDTADVLCEGNIHVNGFGQPADPAAGGYFFKAQRIHRVSVRANVGLPEENLGYPLLYFSQFTSTATDERNDIEFCWNNYHNVTSDTAAEGSGSVGIGQGTGSTGNHYGNFWSYRNNMRQPHITILNIDADDRDSSNPGPFTFENDVIQHSGTYSDGFFISGCAAFTLNTNFFKTNLATGTALLDSSTNLLTGTARTTYLGTHGCEFVLAE